MRVGVVGAGVTGLALTHFLGERGVDVVTCEATGDPGGVVDSRRVDGRVVECGPQRLRLGADLDGLVGALDLRDELVVAADDLPLYVYRDGRLREVPRSLSALVATDLLSWRGKARLLAEPLTAPGEPHETAASLFRRKFGEEAYRAIVEPLFGGTFGSDPARMPARYALAGVLSLERREGSLLLPALRRVRSANAPPPATFEDGLQTLPEALAAANADAVRFDAPVDRVVPAADGDGYVLQIARPEAATTAVGGDEIPVDQVVVTAPAGEAARMLAPVATGAAALDELTYNPLALVHLRADVDRAGFGYQVAREEPLRTLGVTWNASLFDRDGVYTCFLGGMTDPGALELPDEELGDLAAAEFEQVMGAPAEVMHVWRNGRALPAYDHTWDALEGLTLPAGVHLATNYTARMGIPSRVREARTLARTLAD